MQGLEPKEDATILRDVIAEIPFSSHSMFFERIARHMLWLQHKERIMSCRAEGCSNEACEAPEDGGLCDAHIELRYLRAKLKNPKKKAAKDFAPGQKLVFTLVGADLLDVRFCNNEDCVLARAIKRRYPGATCNIGGWGGSFDLDGQCMNFTITDETGQRLQYHATKLLPGSRITITVR